MPLFADLSIWDCFPLTAAVALVLLGLQCYLKVEYISLEAKAGLSKLWNPADLLTWGCFPYCCCCSLIGADNRQCYPILFAPAYLSIYK